MGKARIFKAKKRCVWNGRYWYEDGHPNSVEYIMGPKDPKPPGHFVEIFENKIDAVSEEEPASLLEEQLKGMTNDQILKKIFTEYGVKLSTAQDNGQMVQQAIDVIRNPQLPRIPAGDIGKPKKAPKSDLPAKPVSQLSPDELEKTPVKKLAAMIERDRGKKCNHVGMSKVKLFEIDLKLSQEG